MIGEIHSLKSYKEAKVILPQLKLILHIFNLTIVGLDYFKHFISVSKVLIVLKEQKMILEAHQNKLKKVVEMKGKRV